MKSAASRLMRKGHRAIRRKDYAAACKAFEQAEEATPEDSRPRIQLALAQARGGDYEAARKTALALVESSPTSPLVLLMAGRCLLECGDADAAFSWLESAAHDLPENPVARQYLALCTLMRGDDQAALGQFEDAGFLGSADFLALFSFELERRLLSTGAVTDDETPPPSDRTKLFLERLQARATRKPADSFFGRLARKRAARRLARRGEREFDRGHHADSLAIFEAARAIMPEAAIAHLGAGLSAQQLQQPNRAAQYLADALALQPGDGITGASYGDALYRSARYAEALAAFEKVEPAGPDDFHAHYGCGASLAALRRKQEALEQFRVAFEEYRLEAFGDCLMPSWEEYQKRGEAARKADPKALGQGDEERKAGGGD